MSSHRSVAIHALLGVLFRDEISFSIVVFTPRLLAHSDHGFPLAVLNDPRWNKTLVLEIDAAVMSQMQVRVGEDRLHCILSFDRLYPVEIPYAAILALTQRFDIQAEVSVDTEAPGTSEVHTLPAPSARPALRLVDDGEA